MKYISIFDYSIAMGFLEYIEEPKKVIEKVLSITKLKAFFSFPVDAGMLAWQRKLRYKKKMRFVNVQYRTIR